MIGKISSIAFIWQLSSISLVVVALAFMYDVQTNLIKVSKCCTSC